MQLLLTSKEVTGYSYQEPSSFLLCGPYGQQAQSLASLLAVFNIKEGSKSSSRGLGPSHPNIFNALPQGICCKD
jgi:hypothetical protein